LPIYDALFEYLQAMDFESVKYLKSENYREPSHLCESIWTYISFEYDLYNFSKIKWHFVSPCYIDFQWDFSSNKIISDGINDNPKAAIYNLLREMYKYKKPVFNSLNRLELSQVLTCWTESNLKKHFSLNGCDNIEGLYENTSKDKYNSRYKVGVIKLNSKYHVIYISGASNFENWLEGELISSLEPTAKQSFFKSIWSTRYKLTSERYVSFQQNIMKVIINPDETDLYVKLYPAASN
jgi:hypothetical protein